MAAKAFPTDFSDRGAVKATDKLIIHNIDTGATEYTTVGGLLALITSVTNAANLITTNFSIVQSGSLLLVKYGTTTIVTIDQYGTIKANDLQKL